MSRKQRVLLIVQIVWFVILIAASAFVAFEYQQLGPAMTMVKGLGDWNATISAGQAPSPAIIFVTATPDYAFMTQHPVYLVTITPGGPVGNTVDMPALYMTETDVMATINAFMLGTPTPTPR